MIGVIASLSWLKASFGAVAVLLVIMAVAAGVLRAPTTLPPVNAKRASA